MKRFIVIAIFLTLAGLGFRLFLALRFPTDEPDDGRLYARIATNVLEHRSYSIDVEEPYAPTFIRVPGYPLFIAGIYKFFGRDNNRAVRIVQAALDTINCWFIALLAFTWAPAGWSKEKRRGLLLIALGLAISCPFSAIYVATILTETCATLLISAAVLAASVGININGSRRAILWWMLSGVCGGIATMLRPDSAVFVAAVGFTLFLLVVIDVIRSRTARLDSGKQNSGLRLTLAKTLASPLALAIGFGVALAPWTIRNIRVFGLFQPVAPRHANMPGEFVPIGYIDWLRTWVDDVKYTESMEFPLDVGPLHIERVPEYAFDSAEEQEQVAALIARYNGMPNTGKVEPTNSSITSKPQVSETEKAAEQPTAANPDDPDNEDDSEADDEDKDAEEPGAEAAFSGEMTPEIDAAFGEIARARISRHPLRYYFFVPLKRAVSLWFDTHSQYYPFQGELLPLSELDTDLNQQIWLPLFAFLNVFYTALGLIGAWLMWANKTSRRWLLLITVLIIPRLAFLASLENPEPRYVVEFFGFVLATGSLALAELVYRLRRLRWTNRV
jgi:hypothetical protein